MRTVTLLSCTLAVACDGLDSTDRDVTEPDVVSASLIAPSGVGCVRLRVTGPRNKTLTQSVVAGDAVTMGFGQLPLGSYSVTGEAFASQCPPSGDVVWSTAALAFDVEVGSAALDLDLRFARHPDVNISAGFEPVLAQIETLGSITAALTDDGEVYVWGALGDVSLGNANTNVPVRLTDFDGAVAIDVGYDFMCALYANGVVACAGTNSYRQLGGDGGSGPYPQAVPLSRAAVAISAGPTSACAVLDNGYVECWGDAPYLMGCSASGCVPTNFTTNPTLRIEVEWSSITLLDRAGNVLFYDPGINVAHYANRGVALFGNTRCYIDPVNVVKCHFADWEPNPALKGAVDIVWGSRACVLNATGDVSCYGTEPGTGAASSESLVHVLANVTDLAGPGPFVNRTCAADAAGGAWCWGFCGDGGCGTGEWAQAYTPQRVRFD